MAAFDLLLAPRAIATAPQVRLQLVHSLAITLCTDHSRTRSPKLISTMSSASSGKFAGLSLWLVPRGPSGQAEALRKLMGNLRDEVAAIHGPTSVSVRFEPHVTLLAGLQEGKGWTRQAVWAKTLKVLQDQRQRGETPIVCPLQDVVTRGSYFQVSLLRGDELCKRSKEKRPLTGQTECLAVHRRRP